MPRIRWAPRPSTTPTLTEKFFQVRDQFRARGVDLFFDKERRSYHARNQGRILQTFATLQQAEAFVPTLPSLLATMRVLDRHVGHPRRAP